MIMGSIGVMIVTIIAYTGRMMLGGRMRGAGSCRTFDQSRIYLYQSRQFPLPNRGKVPRRSGSVLTLLLDPEKAADRGHDAAFAFGGLGLFFGIFFAFL